MSTSVSQLLHSAQNQGEISAQSIQVLQVNDIGAQIQAALGVGIDQVQSSEVVLVSILIDDSGSIACANNEDAVRQGRNQMHQALLDSKQGDNILTHTAYLSGQILDPYVLLKNATKMDNSNYNATLGHTPLYDRTIEMLGTVVTKAQEFIDSGVQVRTITLIITDGAENSSRHSSAAKIAQVVKDMLNSERHIVAAMGIGDPNYFNRIFGDMGIQPQWILTPSGTDSDIRKAFQVVSRSAVRASQSAQSFSKVAAGGFGS